jgi:type IV pilus assembly protein PilW
MSHLTHSNGYRSRARGVTLVELMVAMTLALAIVAAVGYVYLQGKQGFSVQDNRSRLQENARLAFSVMSRDILMSGYFGCIKSAVDDNNSPPVATLRITAAQPLMTADISWLELDGDETGGTRFLSPALSVRGYDNGAGWNVPTGISSTRLAGTDAIIILRGGDDARHVTESLNQTTIKIQSALPGLTADDNGQSIPLVVSNCTRGEIVKAKISSGGTAFSVDTNLNKNAVGTSDPLVEKRFRYAPFEAASMVTAFEPVTYYIAPALGKNGVSVPSLYRLGTRWRGAADTDNGSWSTVGNVVMEGVERLQVRYFVEGATEGSSDGPFTAAQVSAASKWLSMVAVQVELTTVSDDNNIRTLQTTQTVGGTALTDNKIRLTTSFTVNIRNPKA